MRLSGRHAVVTGGGTGIGAATARALAAEGAKVTVVGRRVEPLKATAAALAAEGYADVRFTTCDVTDPMRVRAAFDYARARHGRISILVNNAGAAESAPIGRVTAEAWRRAMAVNLDALLHCVQDVLPAMAQADDGRIVTVASTAGLKGYAYTAPYVAAKHGAIGLTRALAAEMAGTAVTVNAVCPGFTETGIAAAAIDRIVGKTGRTPDAARAELARFNPQGRLVAPEEVADAVAWLCLPSSRSVTGQSIVVAGGEVT